MADRTTITRCLDCNSWLLAERGFQVQYTGGRPNWETGALCNKCWDAAVNRSKPATSI